MAKPDPVVHFEMPARNRDRMAEFYQRVFSWQTQMLGPEMGDYVLVTTTETKDERPVTPGAINGGFFPVTPEMPAAYPSVVIAVDNIAASMRRVSEAGGKTEGEPMDIPGIGKFIAFTDTEGNRVSMLQPLPRG